MVNGTIEVAKVFREFYAQKIQLKFINTLISIICTKYIKHDLNFNIFSTHYII